MTEKTELVLKTKGFDMGDFYACRGMHGVECGIVDVHEGFEDRFIGVTFHTGKVRKTHVYLDRHEPRKIRQDTAMRFFNRRWREYEDRIKQRGLEGALAASEEFVLEKLMFHLDRDGTATDFLQNIPEINTGVYVVRGTYRLGVGEDALDSVIVRPRLHPHVLKQLLDHTWVHYGTESIPKKIRSLGRELVLDQFFPYEVPKKCLNFTYIRDCRCIKAEDLAIPDFPTPLRKELTRAFGIS